MTRVLVTGGTGFIGAWVARALVAQGVTPRLFDLRPRPENLDFVQAGLSAQCECVVGDMRRLEDVTAAMQGVAAVIHLAGLMTVDCATNPQLAIEVNLIGGQNLFTAAKAQGVTKVIYASTGGVYGPADPGQPKPMTLYGVLKLALEGVARVAHANDGIASAGFRPYVVYGPGESAGIAAGPSIALRAAAQHEPATIRFGGRVGFVHVADVAAAMVAAIYAPLQGAEVFDLCGPVADMTEFVELLKIQAPEARITIDGPPLKMPQTLSGGDMAPWFNRLPVTPLAKGIEQTLAHWRGAAAGNGFQRAAFGAVSKACQPHEAAEPKCEGAT